MYVISVSLLKTRSRWRLTNRRRSLMKEIPIVEPASVRLAPDWNGPTKVSISSQGSHASWKLREYLLENFHDLESRGKRHCFWNLLSSDADGNFWLQIDMFLQTKIARIVANRYVFWVASCRCAEMLLRLGLCPGTQWGSLQGSPRSPIYCLVLYLNIAGLRQGPGKMLPGSWKGPGIFCNQESGKTICGFMCNKIK